MERYLAEKLCPKSVVDPVDLNTAAVTGNRVLIQDAKRVTFVCVVGTSTSATALQFTTRQHNAASSGTSKDLVEANPYYTKIDVATAYTKVSPVSAAALKDLLASVGDHKAVLIFEVLAEDLDVENGFNYVSIDTADSGAAKLCSIMAYVDSDYKPAYLNVV